MAKYGEIVALLEYMDRKQPKVPKGFFRKKEKAKDPVAQLQEWKAASEAFQNFIKEQEKLNKKEEKKEEKKGWEAMSPLQQAAYLTLGIQLMSLVYLSFMLKLLGKG